MNQLITFNFDNKVIIIDNKVIIIDNKRHNFDYF
jgi:hypothetical protein